ncbi:MAG: DUF58 domain-containing protein [Pseudomonadota bacterium]
MKQSPARNSADPTSQGSGSTYELTLRRIYILPTRHGYVFGCMLFALLVGAANYDNSLAYMLTFALVSVALVSLLHTYRNLVGLKIRVGTAPRVFAGDIGELPIIVENPGHRTRYALDIKHPAACPDEQAYGAIRAHVPANQTTTATVPIRFFSRGQFSLARITVSSRYPFGLFRGWSVLAGLPDCTVFPSPTGDGSLPFTDSAAADGGEAPIAGNADFAGLRDYQPGDPIRTIHWKALARGHRLAIKTFEGGTDLKCVLDWQLIAEPDMELRLEQLCKWVLEAEQSGCRYALRLPNAERPLDRGPAHEQRCLELLANAPRTPGQPTSIASDEPPATWWVGRGKRPSSEPPLVAESR